MFNGMWQSACSTICKSTDIWTITKATSKGTKDLFSTHLLYPNECNGLNHGEKESGMEVFHDHAAQLLGTRCH